MEYYLDGMEIPESRAWELILQGSYQKGHDPMEAHACWDRRKECAESREILEEMSDFHVELIAPLD